MERKSDMQLLYEALVKSQEMRGARDPLPKLSKETLYPGGDKNRISQPKEPVKQKYDNVQALYKHTTSLILDNQEGKMYGIKYVPKRLSKEEERARLNTEVLRNYKLLKPKQEKEVKKDAKVLAKLVWFKKRRTDKDDAGDS